MHDPERQALARAAAVLLAISVARWAAETRTPLPDRVGAGDSTLTEHIAATVEAADEEDRRGRPLEEGERIDPNAASEVELDRLPGVGPATAAAIVTARDSGVVFHRPDDLLAVRGIGPATLERLRPWIELTSPGARSGRHRRGASPAGPGRSTPAGAPGAPSMPVDVNRADVDELQRLPGVGPALARRIVEERAVRPFADVDDLRRVRGIGPATVERLRPMATVGAKWPESAREALFSHGDESCTQVHCTRILYAGAAVPRVRDPH